MNKYKNNFKNIFFISKFLIVIILIFSYQSPVKADYIKDFEIEGMTVGESLLNYLSKTDIKKKIKSKNSYIYPNNSFATLTYNTSNLNIYDDIGVIIKPNDESYIIHALEGTIYFKEDKCLNKQNQITSDLKDFFKDIKYNFVESNNLNYIGDETGESKVTYKDFNFSDGSAIRVICWTLSEKFKSKGHIDALVVAANSIKFMNFINNNM